MSQSGLDAPHRFASEMAARLAARLPQWSDGTMSAKVIQQMTDTEIVSLMRSGELVAKVRQALYHGFAEIEQSQLQRVRPSIIESRKMEFLLAQKIIKLVQDEAAS